MAVLYFSGNQVAFYEGISSSGGNSTFTGVNAPFLATDLVEIELSNQYINANGEFNTNNVQYSRVTVVRDGLRYDFDVESGARIRESSGDPTNAGDTFFVTHDGVGPPSSGPFAGLQGDLVFSSNSTFTTGQTTTIDRTTAIDLNNDGDFLDSGEAANANFNATPA